jgi:membrane-bound serine protease (ClpP class)
VLTVLAILLALFWLPAPWGIVAVSVAALIDVAETVVFMRWSKRRRAAVGVEALVGRRGVVVTALAPRGQVKVDGEIWNAQTDAAMLPGAEVVVRRVEELTLHVEPPER